MKIKGSISRHRYILAFIAVNLVFLALYHRFILMKDAYMYLDIGNDTISTYYPKYVYFSNLLRSGDFSVYHLDFGLGRDIFSAFVQYLNPLDLALILMPEKWIAYGLIVVTFLKINIISLFSYLFIKRITGGNAFSAFAGALLWSFCGYTVLWGQHYVFCTTLMMFTVCLYFIQLYLDGSSISWKILIPLFAIFFLSNYYFLYMSCILYLMYFILYVIFTKKGVVFFAKKTAGMAGVAVVSVLLSSAALIPIAATFLSSSRASSMSYGRDLLETYSPIYRITFLARLLSNNTLGFADDYSGAANYYEAAILCVSSLFIFAFIYLLAKKATVIKTIIIAAISAALLFFMSASHYLTFVDSSHRQSYFICFAEVIAICFFIKDLSFGIFDGITVLIFHRLLFRKDPFLKSCGFFTFPDRITFF